MLALIHPILVWALIWFHDVYNHALHGVIRFKGFCMVFGSPGVVALKIGIDLLLVQIFRAPG